MIVVKQFKMKGAGWLWWNWVCSSSLLVQIVRENFLFSESVYKTCLWIYHHGMPLCCLTMRKASASTRYNLQSTSQSYSKRFTTLHCTALYCTALHFSTTMVPITQTTIIFHAVNTKLSSHQSQWNIHYTPSVTSPNNSIVGRRKVQYVALKLEGFI